MATINSTSTTGTNTAARWPLWLASTLILKRGFWVVSFLNKCKRSPNYEGREIYRHSWEIENVQLTLAWESVDTVVWRAFVWCSGSQNHESGGRFKKKKKKIYTYISLKYKEKVSKKLQEKKFQETRHLFSQWWWSRRCWAYWCPHCSWQTCGCCTLRGSSLLLWPRSDWRWSPQLSSWNPTGLVGGKQCFCNSKKVKN